MDDNFNIGEIYKYSHGSTLTFIVIKLIEKVKHSRKYYAMVIYATRDSSILSKYHKFMASSKYITKLTKLEKLIYEDTAE